MATLSLSQLFCLLQWKNFKCLIIKISWTFCLFHAHQNQTDHLPQRNNRSRLYQYDGDSGPLKVSDCGAALRLATRCTR